MTPSALFDAGYTDLVSVVPPGAPLSPASSLRPETLGKAPGVKRADGTWMGYPWQGAFLHPDDIEDEANVGLAGDRFPGLDIDCDHPTLARLIVQEALAHFGPAPVRTSKHPRRLLVYRTETPFSRIAVAIEYKGVTHKVEMLGAGRQYLVYGRHPSGVDYGWEGRTLAQWPPEELSPVTAAQVIQFGEHLKTLLDGRALVTVAGDGEAKKVKSPAQDSLRAPSHEALAALVKRIPNDERFDERDAYIALGHAIKAAAGGDGSGFPIFVEWCGRWTNGTNDIEVVQADWKRMRAPYRVGWSWLQEQAGSEVAVQEAFAAVPVEGEAPAAAPGVALDGVIEHTDTWVVERLARWLQDRVRYVPETGHWHVWGGRR